MSQMAVTFNQVSHYFDELRALNDLSFSLPGGKLMALLGHNGAGKSTLIKMILGLLDPCQGEVSVLGQTQNPASKAASTDIGYLPENISFYDKLTGHEVLSYFAALKGVSARAVAPLLEEFGLAYAQHKAVKGYSKGMKQRLGFAQAILARPRLLLLDEPTVGLDPQASQFIYHKLKQLTDQGCTAIVCTHELQLVEPQLDLALVLGRGKRLAFGTLDELVLNCGLGVHMAHPALAGLVATHPLLQSFYRDGDLICPVSQREVLMKYLTLECQLFDVKVTLPDLAQVYHAKMAQMQVMSELGLSLTSGEL
ncbi:ATP-binding cassette domain-containing protein [Shewanella sp. JBTF-M18]|uniref:ATP-binding cassette domain-containing protein n=1 Tax=Shewanella insulae TaxID=2681496 RepID=A0A6L7HYB5_9GAMM|nr:ABC transporter ATP-binding protein [Shewanella insulae]MXR69319.1 ATP-binding cassette domain-containing protein [Shewanella insulae]